MKKHTLKLKFHGSTDPNRTQCDTIIACFQNVSLEVQTKAKITALKNFQVLNR